MRERERERGCIKKLLNENNLRVPYLSTVDRIEHNMNENSSNTEENKMARHIILNVYFNLLHLPNH